MQCERGSPLRIGEEAQRCQSNAQCPSSHECKADQGVCCPRKQTICAQPLRVGDCTENVKRYWYNAKTRQCQMFEYTGWPFFSRRNVNSLSFKVAREMTITSKRFWTVRISARTRSLSRNAFKARLIKIRSEISSPAAMVWDVPRITNVIMMEACSDVVR